MRRLWHLPGLFCSFVGCVIVIWFWDPFAGMERIATSLVAVAVSHLVACIAGFFLLKATWRRHAVVLSISLLPALLCWRFFSLGGSDRLKANRIISRIEDYRHRAGHLPNRADDALMQALGFELRVEWDPDYEPLDDTSYRITIFRGFDGPYWFYESKSNRWTHGMPPLRGRAENGSANGSQPIPSDTASMSGAAGSRR